MSMVEKRSTKLVETYWSHTMSKVLHFVGR